MTTPAEAGVVEGSRVVFTDEALEQMRWMLGFMLGGAENWRELSGAEWQCVGVDSTGAQFQFNLVGEDENGQPRLVESFTWNVTAQEDLLVGVQSPEQPRE